MKNEVVKNTRFNTIEKKVDNLEKIFLELLCITLIQSRKQIIESVKTIEKKVTDHHHSKYITTQKINMLIAKNFEERSKQANLQSKTDFDNELIMFNKKITSNKTKYLEVQKNLNILTTKDYNFSLGKIYLGSNDGSQNTFVYQPKLDMLELKKD